MILSNSSQQKIAFQGIPGAYSQIAALKFFNNNTTECIGFATSKELCDAIIGDQVLHGVLPIENSIVGNVNVNLDLIYKHNFYIFGEYYLKINHQLLAKAGTKLSKIKKVYSHPVALSQCNFFLEKHNIKSIPIYDTAGACQFIKDSKSNDCAAIASNLCSEFYKLDLISTNIQNHKNNFTRFVFFTNKQNYLAINNNDKQKISIAIRTSNDPGSLLNCLQVFSCFKINLTRLISKTIPDDPFNYIFFIDFENNSTLIDDNVELALQALKLHTKELKILGQYPKVEISSFL